VIERVWGEGERERERGERERERRERERGERARGEWRGGRGWKGMERVEEENGKIQYWVRGMK
jgi:hypothetical protein